MVNKIIVGVIAAVISGIILFGLGMSGDNEGNSPYRPAPTPPPSPPQNRGDWCCDSYGNKRCQLVTPLKVGTTCFCPGQGYGIVCE